jgi:hypothetical protein
MPRALAALVAVVGVVTAAVLAPTASATPAADGACRDTAGITVVVDFGATGGGVQIGCSAAPVKNGFEALIRAGFVITNVSSQPGFLCQIDGQPADDPCTHVPSAAHYWSYWYAQRGEPWTYSSSGGSRTPPPGSVEGWSFGAGDPPAVAAPAPVVTTTTASTPASTPSSAPSPPAAPPTTVAVVPVSPSEPPDEPSTTTAPAAVGGPAPSAGALAAPAVTTRVTVAADEGDRGSPVGLVAGLTVAAALGGAGALTARRRRALEGGS